MEYPYRARRVEPWVWVLVAVGAVLLIFLVWWAVEAQSPDQEIDTVTVTDEPETPPAVQPTPAPAPPPAQQPVVVERERPVTIYIEREPRERESPRVIVVPRGEQPPMAEEQLQQLDLASQFRYQDKTWRPAGEAVSADEVNLRSTGARVQGHAVYVRRNARTPYNELYLETERGSGIYLRYVPATES